MFWNYGALNSSQYLLLADLAAWNAAKSPGQDDRLIADRVESIERHYEAEGLVDLDWMCVRRPQEDGSSVWEQRNKNAVGNDTRYRFLSA